MHEPRCRGPYLGSRSAAAPTKRVVVPIGPILRDNRGTSSPSFVLELLDPALDGQQLSEPFFDSFGRPARAGPDRLARPVGVDGREVAVRLVIIVLCA